MTKDNMPERILTRHYANGIINARDAKDGWSFSAGNEIANGEYIPASTLTHLEEENARQAAEIKRLREALGKYANETNWYDFEWIGASGDPERIARTALSASEEEG